MKFEKFKQGDLFVRDYVYQFTRLTTFAEELVDTHTKRMERFIRGLRAIIHHEVTSQKPATFDEVVGSTFRAEEEHNRVVAGAGGRCSST